MRESSHPRGRDEIRIPCAAGDLHIFISMFFLCCLSEDMAVGDAISLSVQCNLVIVLTDIWMHERIETSSAIICEWRVPDRRAERN